MSGATDYEQLETFGASVFAILDEPAHDLECLLLAPVCVDGAVYAALAALLRGDVLETVLGHIPAEFSGAGRVHTALKHLWFTHQIAPLKILNMSSGTAYSLVGEVK